MNLNPRELRLAFVTLAVVFLGLGFVVLKNQLARLRDLNEQESSLQLRLLRDARELGRRPELLQALQRIRAQLPQHPVDRDIKSDLSRQVHALAVEAGLTLTGLTSDPEERLEDIDLHQMAIRCSWTGTPEQLLGFLHRLHLLGAVTDLRDLRLRASPRANEGLTGSFVLDFAFSRVTPTAPSSTADSGTAP